MDNIVEINGKKYKVGAWQIWNGGENPVPGKLVQVQLTNQTRLDPHYTEPSDDMIWQHEFVHSNIICYRVMEEVKPDVVEVVRWVEVNPLAVQGVFHSVNKQTESVAKITYNLVDGAPDPKSIKLELV